MINRTYFDFKSLLIALLMFADTTAYGQATGLTEENVKTITLFIDMVKGNQRDLLASRVYYPLKRDYPIPSIRNKAEFLQRYDQVFDSVLIKEIVTSTPVKDWSDVGWRGIMLGNGEIWIDVEGMLEGVNYR